MHSAVENMLEKYQCRTTQEYKNALKEIIQEISLLGLFRSNFFEYAAFYGGTALRIFYGLRRFSEDLDFSLIKKVSSFTIEPYCESIKTELKAYGFEVEVQKKEKTTDSPIESAFIKGGTLIHLLKIASLHPPVSGVHENELLKIKLEIDTDPPLGAAYEIKYHLNPIPFSVKIFTPPSLFAGKIHAVLCRNWNTLRVKGRDLYDFIWYLSQKIPVNLQHLSERMKQSGHLEKHIVLTADLMASLLEKKFDSINMEQAKRDMIPFIQNTDELKLWSPEFFKSILKQIKIESVQ